MLTSEQAFKVGFLLWCADNGLTQEETHAHIKTAMARAKQAGWGTAAVGAGIGNSVAGTPGAIAGGLAGASPEGTMKALPSVLSAATLLGVALPILGGAGGGYLAAKATGSNKDDVEQAKQEEIEGEYYRLAQEARRNAARKRLQSRVGRKVTLLSPAL